MKASDIFRGFLKAAKEEGIAVEADALLVETAATATQAQAAEPTTEQSAQDARIQELERRLAEQRQAQIAQAAAAFADSAIRDRRAFPAEHAALLALYVQAAADDDARPAAEGQRTRVAQLEASITARPQHSLSQELIATGAGGVLETAGTEQGMTEERRRKLLSMTPLGQAVLKNERAKSA